MSKPAGDPLSQMWGQLTPENSEVRALALAAAPIRKVKVHQAKEPLATTGKYYTHLERLRALPVKRPLWDYYPEAKHSPTYIMRLVNGVEQWIRDGAPAEAQGHYYAEWLVKLADECKKDSRPLDPALALLVHKSPALHLLAEGKGKPGRRHSQGAADKWFRKLVDAKKAIDSGTPVRAAIPGEEGKLRKDYYRLTKPIGRVKRKNLPTDIAIKRVMAIRQFRQECALQAKLDALENKNNTPQF